MEVVKSRQSGITIIEAVVYVALLAVISTTTVDTYISMTKAFRILRVERSLHQSAEAGFELIMRTIRGSSSVDVPASSFGVEQGVLVLDGAAFSLSNGSVMASIGGAPASAITPSDATVTSLRFYYVPSGTVSESITAVMDVSGTHGNFTKSFTVRDTAVLRGSY